ncbi:hypothetical protein BRADI_2g50403v3 [Brachypodium distachyon]|uniref:Uncharacterized protein n=1 Tax=Brachypodium distachyon TaxID=15368 RepID=A0A2K2DF21_BRADI|nr:hypothetical protein BRADI_2g50403v3 [Brachypodium distachyon]
MPCSIGYLLSRRELLKIISSVTCIQAPFSQHPSTFLYFHSFFPSKNRPIHLHLKWCSLSHFHCLQGWNSEFLVVAW